MDYGKFLNLIVQLTYYVIGTIFPIVEFCIIWAHKLVHILKAKGLLILLEMLSETRTAEKCSIAVTAYLHFSSVLCVASPPPILYFIKVLSLLK